MKKPTKRKTRGSVKIAVMATALHESIVSELIAMHEEEKLGLCARLATMQTSLDELRQLREADRKEMADLRSKLFLAEHQKKQQDSVVAQAVKKNAELKDLLLQSELTRAQQRGYIERCLEDDKVREGDAVHQQVVENRSAKRFGPEVEEQPPRDFSGNPIRTWVNI